MGKVYFPKTDWANRVKEAGIRFEILPILALLRRIHGSNLSRRDPHRCTSDFLRAVKLAMDRRRGIDSSPRQPETESGAPRG